MNVIIFLYFLIALLAFILFALVAYRSMDEINSIVGWFGDSVSIALFSCVIAALLWPVMIVRAFYLHRK